MELDGALQGVQVTISMGTALRRRGESFDALNERADRTLYTAKQAGRNRVVSADTPAPGDPA